MLKTNDIGSMTEVQIGQNLELTPMYRRLPPRAWISPIKFEDKRKWGIIETAIVEAIVWMARVNERSEISYRELVRRLQTDLHVEEKYLLEVLPRLVRTIPQTMDGNVKRLEFRPVPLSVDAYGHDDDD